MLLLIGGCLIYLSWRSEHTNLYIWCRSAGLNFFLDCLRTSVGTYDPGAFVTESLPDGLFCAAYVLVMDCIWDRSGGVMRVLMILLMPAVAVIHEILQYFGVVSGTFDPIDLACYVVPPLTYIIILRLTNQLHTK
ncbi:MAG: hypothetical protein NC411_03265 [Bacteroides sp.]|nr:hypothetical protein [Bacteroides sp.]